MTLEKWFKVGNDDAPQYWRLSADGKMYDVFNSSGENVANIPSNQVVGFRPEDELPGCPWTMDNVDRTEDS